MLCCVWFLISLPSSAASDDVLSSVPSASANEDGGPNAPTPDGNYPLTLAEEVQQTERHPVNASLLTMLLVVTVASFAASVLLFLATNARRQGAIRSWVLEDRTWPNTGDERLSFLGLFRL